MAVSLGKMPMTSERRFTSPFNLSSGLVEGRGALCPVFAGERHPGEDVVPRGIHKGTALVLLLAQRRARALGRAGPRLDLGLLDALDQRHPRLGHRHLHCRFQVSQPETFSEQRRLTAIVTHGPRGSRCAKSAARAPSNHPVALYRYNAFNGHRCNRHSREVNGNRPQEKPRFRAPVPGAARKNDAGASGGSFRPG